MAAAVMLLALLTACGGSAPVAQSSGDLTVDIDRLVDQSQPAAAPGLVILLRTHGDRFYVRSQGMADVASNSALSMSTTVQTASLSKPFTALAVLDLVSQHRLELTDSVLQFLPELPASWSEIRIHHLLSHQSGIPDFLNTFPKPQLNGFSNADLVAYFSQHPALDFVPGARGAYSNANYVLLAEIIARTTGRSFGSFMKESLFDRLGMRDSYIAEPGAVGGGQALNLGTNLRPDGIVYAVTGPINQISTLNDLDVFLHALESGVGISSQLVDSMAVSRATFSDGSHYGYGFFVASSGDVLAHGGLLDGYRSLIYINRRKAFSLVMLGNGGGRVQQLQQQILQTVRSALE